MGSTNTFKIKQFNMSNKTLVLLGKKYKIIISSNYKDRMLSSMTRIFNKMFIKSNTLKNKNYSLTRWKIMLIYQKLPVNLLSIGKMLKFNKATIKTNKLNLLLPIKLKLHNLKTSRVLIRNFKRKKRYLMTLLILFMVKRITETNQKIKIKRI